MITYLILYSYIQDSLYYHRKRTIKVNFVNVVGAFFYIGNEDGVKNYPDRWRKHAIAIKEVDPTIKTIFNCNYLNPKALEEIVDRFLQSSETQKYLVTNVYNRNLEVSSFYIMFSQYDIRIYLKDEINGETCL